MKRLLFFLLLCTTLFAEEKPVTIRVLLTKLANEALIEVKGRHHLYNPKTETFLSSNSKKKKARITPHEKGLYWGDLLSDVFELRIVPDEKNCSILVDGIQYKGWIEIYNIGGTINIVNEVDVENFLKATLSPKVPTKLSKETLDAIVITERTNLYHTIEKGAYASWQLEAEKEGYFGIAQSRSICDAIERTRDIILHYKKKPFTASWGLDHTGRSVTFPAIFRKESEVPPGVDNLPSLHDRAKSKWKSAISTQVLAQIAGQTTLTGIDLFRAEKSHKVYAIRLIGPTGYKDINIQNFQKALGTNALQSNDFTAFLKGKRVYFTGYGQGLGTGLCIASSEILSLRKASAENILTTHFPQTKLINIRQETGKRLSMSPAWQ
ncbi:MAG: hypothetical protein KR126chlam3_00500 [Chlamydiae bacterium]|nr:hypothetical protein [Chlamydiota bacterium]